MAKYAVYISTIADARIEIEADDSEEAIEKLASGEVELPWLCAQCSGWGSDHDLDLSEAWDWDDARVEKVYVG